MEDIAQSATMIAWSSKTPVAIPFALPAGAVTFQIEPKISSIQNYFLGALLKIAHFSSITKSLRYAGFSILS